MSDRLNTALLQALEGWAKECELIAGSSNPARDAEHLARNIRMAIALLRRVIVDRPSGIG